jgi:hypothetical protein
MPRPKKLPEDFTVQEAWDELMLLLEMIEKDLKKATIKGTKRAGINARKGLKYSKDLIANIIHGSLIEQKKVRSQKPPHGNKNGPGIQAMRKAREKKQLENQ